MSIAGRHGSKFRFCSSSTFVTDSAQEQFRSGSAQPSSLPSSFSDVGRHPSGGSDDVDLVELKRKSVRGGTVTIVSQGASILIQLLSTAILARLLSPEDYGIVAMVLAVTAFAGLFRDLGLSSAAVQKKELTHAAQSNLFWLNAAMGAALTLIVAAASPLLAVYYQRPELTLVTLALSTTFLIGSLSTQHGALLTREMQFGRLAIPTIASGLISLLVTAALAWNGGGYWSIVWGNLASSLTVTGLRWILSPFRPAWFCWGCGMRDMLGFGANVTAFDFVNYFARNLDNILIGRFCGTSELGLYSKAYQLLMFPITAIRAPILAVAYPAMCRLQAQPASLRDYYKGMVSTVSLLTMPIVGLLYVNAKPLVELVMGSRWLAAADLFEILAITAFIQTPLSLNGTIQLATGRSAKYAIMGTTAAVVTSLGFLLGVRWGASGIAYAYAVTTYLMLVPMLLWAYHGTTITLLDFFRQIRLPATASLLGVAAASSLQQWIQPVHPVIDLFIGAGAFSLILLPCYLASSSVRLAIRTAIPGLLQFGAVFRAVLAVILLICPYSSLTILS